MEGKLGLSVTESPHGEETLGKFIARVRRERAIGLGQLAQQTRIDKAELERFELGEAIPDAEQAARLDTALIIGPGRLLRLLSASASESGAAASPPEDPPGHPPRPQAPPLAAVDAQAVARSQVPSAPKAPKRH